MKVLETIKSNLVKLIQEYLKFIIKNKDRRRNRKKLNIPLLNLT